MKKTIRYEGHCRKIKFLRDSNFFSDKPLDEFVDITNVVKYLLPCGTHARWEAELLDELGFYRSAPIPENVETIKNLTAYLFGKYLPKGKEDILVGKIIVKGIKDEKPKTIVYDIQDEAKDGYTAMQRTTGFTISIIAQMIAKGEIMERGVLDLINPATNQERIIEEVRKRGIQISKSIE